MPEQPSYRSQVLDHLGLVAGMFDELAIGDVLDHATHHNPELRDLTVGEAVKAMGLNGLGLPIPRHSPPCPRRRKDWRRRGSSRPASSHFTLHETVLAPHGKRPGGYSYHLGRSHVLRLRRSPSRPRHDAKQCAYERNTEEEAFGFTHSASWDVPTPEP
jgi:hypothetical protein